MEVDHLKRNGPRVRKAYTVLEDNSVICNMPMEVHIPKRFVDNGMATVADKVVSNTVLGLVLPDEKVYAPFLGLMQATLVPLSIREVAIKGVQYLVLGFEKGDTLVESLSYLQDPNLPHTYYLEFNLYAKLPWFMSKDDLSQLYDNSKNECGAGVGSSPQVMRVYTAQQMRDPDNPDQPYRYSKAMLEGRPPLIVGLNNPSMLIDGTFPKLLGGYMRDNTLSAIVNPDTKVTDLEAIIKGVPV